MLQNLNCNELIALSFVLQFVDVKTLLTGAMNGLANEETEKAKDEANICFEAIHAFLK